MKYKHMQYNFLWKPKKSKHRKISNSLFVRHLLKRRLADGNRGRLTQKTQLYLYVIGIINSSFFFHSLFFFKLLFVKTNIHLLPNCMCFFQ